MQDTKVIERNWLSSTGLPQKAYDIVRADGMELGSIQEFNFHVKSRVINGYGSWMALSKNGNYRYFVRQSNAVRWLENQMRNTYPLSRLNEMLESI